MPSRLPVRPPPRALHYTARAETPVPLCGVRPRGALHVTANPALVTCPRCRAMAGVP
jgi:hypothetical protein